MLTRARESPRVGDFAARVQARIPFPPTDVRSGVTPRKLKPLA